MNKKIVKTLIAAGCISAVTAGSAMNVQATDAIMAALANAVEIVREGAAAEEAAPEAEEAVVEETAVEEAAGEAVPAEEEVPAEETAEEVPAEAAEISDDLYSFQFSYAGNVYELPMYYNDFVEQGWRLAEREDPEMKIGCNSYGMVTMWNGNFEAYADLLNLGINEIGLDKALVGGVDLDVTYSDVDLEATPIVFPAGIEMGKATIEDIKAAYGEPSDVYESDLYTKLTYEQDYYQSAEFYVWVETGVLQEVSLRNFAAPEGYDIGTVNTDTPDVVAAYTAPEALGEDMFDPTVEFFGDLYTLPAPVSAFIANGWTMLDVPEGAYVAGDDIEFIDMSKENQSVHFSIYNMTENAVTLENCFVKELSFATYDPEVLAMKLSGGYTIGMDKADIMAAAEEKGYICEYEDGYLDIYKNEETKYDLQIECWVNEDEDPNAVASISFWNENLPK